MKITKQLTLPLSLLLLSACGGSDNASENDMNTSQSLDTVTYELTFTSTWNSSTFATNYPSNAHFSPLVGLTHNSQRGIFTTGESASSGIISMAETGSKTRLKEEIGVIQNLGHSNYLIDELGIPTNDTSVTITFEASKDFPLLSIVSMVAPSPDWFIGINSLSLFENEQWIENKTVQLKVYDAGSDSGTTFKSSDSTTTPANVIKLLSTNRSDSNFEEGVHFETQAYIGNIEIKMMK
ncbi:spondin domain-containing protein [Pseudoalteromonas denitrificans]|uniref:Spondin_N n=1 Tax=Pseudoalteromonas denitrificans DSM 6059 TaxID=1123010 RepID=A0A1I1UYK9_9GAMM|nr:spondin domain-containing protein [Pseudoalteromonas denitrificans]SFD75912.1 Spondin_N [Pseudoalteromonas denitrificans DSM 6059]